MDELITQLKELGFSVYGPQTPKTYVYFTDGTRIGYAEFDRMSGVKYATVHKANVRSGTGFRCDTPQQALMTIPPGFHGVEVPTKFANFEAFRKQHWQPLVEMPS